MKRGITFYLNQALFCATLVSLFFPTLLISQTVTRVVPTRVTEGVTIRIEGFGFTDQTAQSISFVEGGMNARNKVKESDNLMTFEIGRNATTISNTPEDDDYQATLQIRIGGTMTPVQISGENVMVDYIAPKAMIHAVNDLEGRLEVENRVEEIYTDYGGLKRYEDGDEFTRGRDINSTTYGRWEFFNLTFPSTPSGILIETGGRGRGMFVGFNSSGRFIARGGDGRSLSPVNGCARLDLDPSIFANTIGGRLLVTMDPRDGSGVLTVEWDADDDGNAENTWTVTAGGNYMGYNAFREWSGGNQGFVGKSNGNIAGDEVSGTADFNGTIGYMEFSNYETVPIAWRSTDGTYPTDPIVPTNPIIPDNYHDLLGFKMEDGNVYSTGVNDELLETFLGAELVENTNYFPQRFKAYSTNGVQNTTVPQHHIFTGEFVDGKELEGTTEFRTGPNDPNNLDPNDPNYDIAFANIRGLSMFEVLIDGVNGLNIGSGINNLNRSTSIQFYSGDGQFGGVADGVPDLLIPNMAEAGGTDVYYYTDFDGNVIGRPISIRINNSDTNNPPLSHWQNDQYRVTNEVEFDVAEPTERIYGNAQERPMRLIAFSLEDFGITELPETDPNYNSFTNIKSIFNINAGAGGTADVPFLAYNADTFQIKSPVIVESPVSRNICEVNGNIDVVFEVVAQFEGQVEGDPLPVEGDPEFIEYQWYRYNDPLPGETNSILIIDDVQDSDLGDYKVLVYNQRGSRLEPTSLKEGGTPAFWNGTEWTFRSGFTSVSDPSPEFGDVLVADEDRRLVFQEDYNLDDDLVGCDCILPEQTEVTIRQGRSLKLYDELIIRPESLDDEGEIIEAGKLILENGASLVQTKSVNVNINEGDIEMHRETADLNDFDYVFWSSPVDEFNLSDVGDPPPSQSFVWDQRALNANQTDGDWVPYSGPMTPGTGYIARVDDYFGVREAIFKGVPNNGLVETTVYKTLDFSGVNGDLLTEDRHWNLVGNPFPSAISAEKFLTNPINENVIWGAVNIWVSDNATLSSGNPDPFYEDQSYSYSNAYIAYNKLGSSTPNTFSGNIASGQGFFVQVLDTANDTDIVEFRNEMRYTGVNKDVIDNTDFKRLEPSKSVEEEEEDERQRIWLSLINEQDVSSTALIGYASDATFARDRLYDANVNRGPGDLSIYSILDNGRLVIQGRPLPFDETDEVLLGVQIPSTGVYRIGIDELDGSLFLNEDTDIILEDIYTGTLHDLREEPFSFEAQAGTYNDRFVLKYMANALSTSEVEQPDTFVYIKDGQFYAQSTSLITNVKVYDLSGKLVMNYQPERNSTNMSTPFNYARGVYISVITLDGNISVSKKLVN